MTVQVVVLNGRLAFDILLHNFGQPFFHQRVVVLYPGWKVDVLLELGGYVFMLCFVKELGDQVEYFFEER
jgi:hypothetical protein